MLYLAYSLSDITETFICCWFFLQFAPRRVKGVLFYILCVFFTALQFVNNALLLKSSVLVSVGSVIFCFLLSLLYETGMGARVFLSLAIYVVSAGSEVLTSMATSLITGKSVTELSLNVPLFFISMPISEVLRLVLFWLIAVLKRNSRLDLTKKLAFEALSFPLASLAALMIMYYSLFRIHDYMLTVFCMAASVLLCAANVMLFYVLYRQNDYVRMSERLSQTERLLTMQTERYQELYGYQRELRAFRHDEKNMMLALAALLREGRCDEALERTSDYLSLLDDRGKSLADTGDPVIDAVLQAKMNAAAKAGAVIKYSVRLAEPILVEGPELAVCIGNALDNAVEAVAALPETQAGRTIRFDLTTGGGRVVMTVVNPCSALSSPDRGTSKADKLSHGFGLDSIRAIAKRYGGVAAAGAAHGVFTLTVGMDNTAH